MLIHTVGANSMIMASLLDLSMQFNTTLGLWPGFITNIISYFPDPYIICHNNYAAVVDRYSTCIEIRIIDINVIYRKISEYRCRIASIYIVHWKN